jgi:hypothetical protein
MLDIFSDYNNNFLKNLLDDNSTSLSSYEKTANEQLSSA